MAFCPRTPRGIISADGSGCVGDSHLPGVGHVRKETVPAGRRGDGEAGAGISDDVDAGAIVVEGDDPEVVLDRTWGVGPGERGPEVAEGGTLCWVSEGGGGADRGHRCRGRPGEKRQRSYQGSYAGS